MTHYESVTLVIVTMLFVMEGSCFKHLKWMNIKLKNDWMDYNRNQLRHCKLIFVLNMILLIICISYMCVFVQIRNFESVDEDANKIIF